MEIQEPSEIFKFDIKGHGKNLLDELMKNDIFLNSTWEYNNLDSFQDHNFLLTDDISFLKDTVRKIFKSKFWEEIVSNYCDNDFIGNNAFKNDDFIEQFLNRIVFLPFDIKDLGLFAYTTADDLFVFVSGYPYMDNNCSSEKYIVNRILQLGVSIIIILHEAIHYFKRLLFFITCGMVSRLTIIDNDRKEGGQLFEEILLGWTVDEGEQKIKNISKKINIITALNLLNSKIYEKGIDFAQTTLSSGKIFEGKDDLLENYLVKLNLSSPQKYQEFIDKNRNKNINASRQCLNKENEFDYSSSDHRKSRI